MMAPSAGPAPLIVCRGLGHIYPGGVEALRGVDLTVYDGDVVGVIGRNGSGKTTLAKHFNGLLKPTSGEVLVKGRPTRGRKICDLSRDVGYVFQNPDEQLFLPSIEAEVNYGPTNIGMPEAERAEIVERVLRELGLSEKRQVHPFRLSTLERKMLSIACVLAMKPQVIVFDEPTTGQDVIQTRAVMNLLHEFSRAGHTLAIISHDMALVAEYCSRVVVMSRGCLLADGPPAEISSRREALEQAGVEPPDIAQMGMRLGLPRPVLSVAEMQSQLRAHSPAD